MSRNFLIANSCKAFKHVCRYWSTALFPRIQCINFISYIKRIHRTKTKGFGRDGVLSNKWNNNTNNALQIHCCLQRVCKFLFDRNQGILLSCKVHDGNSFGKLCESVRVTEPKPPISWKGRLRGCLIITLHLVLK